MSDPKSFLAAVGRMAEAGNTSPAPPDFERLGFNEAAKLYDPGDYARVAFMNGWRSAQSSLASQLSDLEAAKNDALTLANLREAEIERLEAERNKDHARMSDAIGLAVTRAQDAEAEVARLREALKTVANKIEAYLANIDTPDDFITDAAKDARALARPPGAEVMPDSTAQRMIEAGARGADPSMHDLCLRLKGDQQADERFAAMQKQSRGCLLSSLRALAESGPSEGMIHSYYAWVRDKEESAKPAFPVIVPADTFVQFVRITIAELEKEPTDAR